MGNETAQSVITKDHNEIKYKSYSHLLCEQKTETLTINQIDQSKFQNDILGYQDGIYLGFDAQPEGIPADLVEVWCQSVESNYFLETISYYNRFSKQSVTRLYYSETDPYLTEKIYKNDLNTSRLIEANSVALATSAGFSLIVDRLQLLPGFKGQYSGMLSESNENFSVKNAALRCRLGGGLDSSVWPAQRLVDLNFSANSFLLSQPAQWFFSSEQRAEEDNFFYKINTSKETNESSLFKLDLSKAEKKMIDNQLLFKSNKNFLFEASDDSLTIKVNNQKIGNKNIDQILQLDLKTNRLVEITSTAATNGFLASDFQNLPNNKILFSEWIDTLNVENFGTLLKIYDPRLLKASTIQLKDNQFITSPLGYIYQKKSEQIFITQHNKKSRPEIFYKYKMSSADLENFTPAFFKWPWSIGMVDVFTDPDSETSILYNGLNFSTAERYKFLTTFDSSRTITMPPDSYSITSADGNYTFFNTIQDMVNEVDGLSSTSYLVNISNGQKIPIGSHLLFETFFLKNSQSIVGHLRKKESPFSRAVELNVNQPQNTKEICSDNISATTSTFAFDVFRDSSILLMALNIEYSMVYFYKVNENKKCELLNSITSKEFDQSLFDLLFSVNSKNAIVSFKSYFELKMAPDQSGFVFGVRNKPMDIKKPRALAIQKLIYVPTNNRASYVMNTPFDTAGFIDDFRFLNNSRGVVYIGNQIDKDQHNIFLWKIPKK